MLLRLLDIEWRKLLKHPLLWLELAGLIGILAMYFLLRYALIVSSARHGMPSEPRALLLDLQDGLELFGFVSVLFYAASASLVASYDFPERGVQAWLARGVPRPLLIWARLAIVLLVGFLLVTAAAFAALGLSQLAHLALLGSRSAGDLDWAHFGAAILRMSWGAVPYLSLSVLLSVASRSPLFAAGGVVVFRTALENGLLHLADRFPDLVRFLPAQLALALQVHTYTMERAARAAALDAPVLSEPQAILAIGAFLILLGAASAILFSLQDWGG